MDVRLVTPSSSTADADMSAFLSLTSPSSPLMHTLQPLLPNANVAESDLGIISNELEIVGGGDVSRHGSYDLLNSAGVTQSYSASNSQDIGFISMDAGLSNSAETKVSSVDLPVECTQYYVRHSSGSSMKLGSSRDSGNNHGQMNPSAVVTLPAQQQPVLSNSPHRVAEVLSVPSQFIVPGTQTLTNFRPAGVVDVSTPPKKPLSPYMRFSKGIWQQVKSANPSMSVCEVGATIGRMWREMNDENKQHFNDDFALDKLRYDSEMQHYLIANGLQPSDLSKSKKKKDSKDKSPTISVAASAVATQPLVTLTPEQMAEEMARTILESAGICADPAALSSLASETSLGDEQLQSFSQVWTGADTVMSPQLCLTADQSFSQTGTTDTLPQSSVSSGTSQPVTLCSFSGDSQLFAGGDMVAHQLLASGDDAASWLWQQYTADNQSTSMSSQMTADNTSLMNVSSLNDFIMAMDAQLEPGEVRPAAPAANQPANLADVGSPYTWAGLSRDAAELALLRNALVTRGKEAARLTRELELAYKLIEQLQHQNIAYQQLEWNLRQTSSDQLQHPHQQPLETNVGLIVSNGIN